MSHPFKSWYGFGGVAVQEREQEVSDSDINLGDYLVEGWDKDWEQQFWEKNDEESGEDKSVVQPGKNIEQDDEEHPEAVIEEQAVSMEPRNAFDPETMAPRPGSVSLATGPAHPRSPMPILSKQKVQGDHSQVEQSTAFSKDPSTTKERMRDIPDKSSEDDDDLPVRAAKKRKRTSIAVTSDADESQSDRVPLAARKRRHVTKTPASKPKVSRADSKLDLDPEESESGGFSVASDSDSDFDSPPLKSRAKARFRLSSKPRRKFAPGASNTQQMSSNASPPGPAPLPATLSAISRIRYRDPKTQQEKNTILHKPKHNRDVFLWDFQHLLTVAIMEHHLGLTRGEPQHERDGERIFSFLFADDLELSRQKAGSKSWADAIYNSYGQKDRTKARRRFDPVQAAIEAPEDAKSDEYKETRQKVFDAARQLGIQSRLFVGQTKVVEFDKKY